MKNNVIKFPKEPPFKNEAEFMARVMLRGMFEKQGYKVDDVFEDDNGDMNVVCNINEPPVKKMIIVCSKPIDSKGAK